MRSIGIRELRQEASRWLRLVASGETITVTDRGHPVALLTPVSTQGWEAMVQSGRLTAPTLSLDEIKPLPGDGTSRISESLAELRQDER